MSNIQLLPPGFDDHVKDAVEVFWRTRASGSTKQEGSRGDVISGKHLDGFHAVAKLVALHCGVPNADVYDGGSATLPGYFRATKNWDILVIRHQRLVAALEFKSQIGSWGNNQNNRIEEALGLGLDFNEANASGLYRSARHIASDGMDDGDPRSPFTGYLVLIEDTVDTNRGVRVASPHYPVNPHFMHASYAERYRYLCEYAMQKQIYDAASVLLASREDGENGDFRELSAPTSAREFFLAFAAQLARAYAV